jgi:hypothetical protein
LAERRGVEPPAQEVSWEAGQLKRVGSNGLLGSGAPVAEVLLASIEPVESVADIVKPAPSMNHG